MSLTTDEAATVITSIPTDSGPKAKPAKAKKAAAKKPATKKGKASKAKANTAPKSKPMSNDGKSVHADLPTREPLWNDRRKNIVVAMRNLGANDAKSAVTAAQIAKAAGSLKGSPELKGDNGVFLTKIILDVYRTAELLHNGFAQSTRHEGDRELRYYLLAKGKNTKFPAKPSKKAE